MKFKYSNQVVRSLHYKACSKQIFSYLFVIVFSCLLQATVVEAVAKESAAAVNAESGNPAKANHYTIEDHEQILKNRKRELQELISTGFQSNSPDLLLLEQELDDVNRDLLNLQESYQKKAKSFSETIHRLELLKNELDNRAFDAAVEDLKTTGNNAKINALLIQLEKQEQSSTELAAKFAFECGQIAKDEFRYDDAFDLFKKAVELAPQKIVYLENAAFVAAKVAAYDLAIEWNEVALKVISDGVYL